MPAFTFCVFFSNALMLTFYIYVFNLCGIVFIYWCVSRFMYDLENPGEGTVIIFTHLFILSTVPSCYSKILKYYLLSALSTYFSHSFRAGEKLSWFSLHLISLILSWFLLHFGRIFLVDNSELTMLFSQSLKSVPLPSYFHSFQYEIHCSVNCFSPIGCFCFHILFLPFSVIWLLCALAWVSLGLSCLGLAQLLESVGLCLCQFRII